MRAISNYTCFAVIFFLVASSLLLSSCQSSGVRQSQKRDVEKAHALKMPPSARNFQQASSGHGSDKGVASMFQCDPDELGPFLTQLKIKSRRGPQKEEIGDPCVNGWNIWPTDASTFVPGNPSLKGFQKTWQGDAMPVEMLSCDSNNGDWLHVEVWMTSLGSIILKLYTDWN